MIDVKKPCKSILTTGAKYAMNGTFWDELKYVLALGRAGSMTKAAANLKSSTATVSRKIQSASDHFGQPIFQKQKDGWKLTAVGQQIFDLADKFEMSLSNLQSTDDVEELPKTIFLTTLDFLVRSVLSPNFLSLREKHPQLELTLHSSNENLSLAYGEADIAVRMARPTSGRLISRKLGEFKYTIFGIEGGDHSNWVGREESLDWIPEVTMAKNFFEKSPVIRVGDYKAALDTIKSMKIAAVLPEIMAQNDKEIVAIAGAPVVWREAWMIVHESRKNDPALRAVMDWLVESFKANNRSDAEDLK
jgi:DNA-binding transcriptional LysR family regulator